MDIKELRQILTEASALCEDGPWTWDVNEGPDGHWDNTFVVSGPAEEFVAECEYRPQAELLVAAHNHLGALLDVAEYANALRMSTPEHVDEGYTDERFPEFARGRRRDADGNLYDCLICGCGPGEPHDLYRHEDWEAANDATW